MKKNLYTPALALLAFVGAFGSSGPVAAQVAGGTTSVDVAVIHSTQLAMGWSVKKTLLGKSIYNDAGQEVGTVEDLIVSPQKDVSYVIVGAGGFIGIGRHDVAIPVTQIQDLAGKLVMPGATKDMIKAMPEFVYADHTEKRNEFVKAAEKDISKGKEKLADLAKKAGSAGADAKGRIELQITVVQADVKSVEAKLGEMKQATAVRWQEFEAGVTAAITRLRKSIDTATG